MKITGINIDEYRQFKNIKFDFTYPADHHDQTKAGKPLEKVCFIGQSGTGKTTLLNIIWDFFNAIEIARTALFNTSSFNTIPDNFLPESIDDAVFSVNLDDQLFTFDRQLEIHRSDKDFLSSWLIETFSRSQQYILQDTNKLCLFIKDSIAQDADAFLVDQEKAPQSFSDFVKTDNEIEQERTQKEEKIKLAGQNRVVSLGERKSMNIWRHLLKEIFEYDETGKAFARSIVHEADSSSINSVIERLVHWKKHTTNPRVDLAATCLNPLLNHFYLEIDTEGDKVPIVIKTKQGLKIDSAYLSAGTRQLLATAIPIYKFDTKDTVILFDEPERSLFPDVQRGLIDYYTSLAPEAQFFFATHSPIIASAFEPCERFILYFDENGEVKCHTGVAPEGDDPNDILSEDFGLEELMLKPGLDAYKRYRNLFVEIRNEKDPVRQKELIVEQAKLGDQYKF